MKKYVLISMFIFSVNYSQEKKEIINCQSIRNGLFDEKLFIEIKGKFISKVDLNKTAVSKVVIDNSKFYYVSEGLKDKIEKYLKTCQCPGVAIEKLDTKKQIKITRD